MRQFKWRLQRVLDVKKIEENSRRNELMAVTERLASTQSEYLLKKRMLADEVRRISTLEPAQRLNEQQFFMRYSQAATERIKKLKEKVTHLESQQKEKIEQVLAARRFREGLEKLREKARQEYVAEQLALEQKELDEAGQNSFIRQNTAC